MFYPILNKNTLKRRECNSFGGYFHNSRVPPDSFYDCRNLTSDSFPLIKTRPKRAIWCTMPEDSSEQYPGMMIPGYGITAVKEVDSKIVFVTGQFVSAWGEIINDVRLDKSISSHNVAVMGRDIFIAPEGEFVKLSESTPVVYHGNVRLTADDSFSCSFCREDGSIADINYYSAFPETASEGEYAVYYQGNFMELYKYTGEGAVYEAPLYIKLTVGEHEGEFNKGDHIFIENCSFIEDGIYTCIDSQGNSLILKGKMNGRGSMDGAVISKKIPLMDFVVEHNNRLFGCRYGVDRDGKFVNEIYASAVGEPLNWYCFEGLSTDPYAAGLGCGGEFTGAATMGGDVIFFKEDYIIRVSGNTPSDFYVSVLPARGVEKGSSLSLMNLNEKLFYKTRNGIAVYDGTFPVIISDALGEMHYTDAVAGANGGKYYIAMTDTGNRRSIFTYDTRHALWHREDDEGNTRYMVNHEGSLFFVGLKGQLTVMNVPFMCYVFRVNDYRNACPAHDIFKGSDPGYKMYYTPEEKVSWFFETGRLGEEGNIRKTRLRGLYITLTLGEDAYTDVSILPDSENEWKKLCRITSPVKKTFSIPVSVVPCHSYRLRFDGQGECEILSITRLSQISGKDRGYE